MRRHVEAILSLLASVLFWLAIVIGPLAAQPIDTVDLLSVEKDLGRSAGEIIASQATREPGAGAEGSALYGSARLAFDAVIDRLGADLQAARAAPADANLQRLFSEAAAARSALLAYTSGHVLPVQERAQIVRDDRVLDPVRFSEGMTRSLAPLWAEWQAADAAGRQAILDRLVDQKWPSLEP